MRKWSIDDSAELYNINGWGLNYFSINEKGHVAVTPKTDGPSIDLKELMEELQVRDVEAPVLLRFPDILDNRIEKISNCFQAAAREYGYSAKNFIIYPIKVNQMRPVVEEIVSHGNKFNIGLEAGSKPELHAVLSIDIDDEAMIICNGYKDESLIGLKNWYADYINKTIKTSEGNIGLPEEVYTLKPAKTSNFEYSYKTSEFKEPQNIIEEIKQLFKNIGNNFKNIKKKMTSINDLNSNELE